LLTTGEGASRAELTLLDEEKGHFRRFCGDYGLTGLIRFERDHIHVIRDALDRPLRDIATEQDSHAVGDFIADKIKHFTEQSDSSLHVSIAGGRKTMGFYAGYALSLFGRPQDRLSHVIVSDPFESTQEFYYPPPKPQVIFTRDQRPVRTDEASIMLAEIPFVRLRDGIPRMLRQGKASFGEVVESAQRNLIPTQVVLLPSKGSIRVGDTEVRLEPRQFAFYGWLAERRMAGAPPLRIAEAGADGFVDAYSRVLRAMGRDEFTVDDLCERFEGQARLDRKLVHELCSRINGKLEDLLGPSARYVHGILVTGERGDSEYSLAVPADRINWEE
jgi:CRISPR-associated protein (TIGR02584 family)